MKYVKIAIILGITLIFLFVFFNNVNFSEVIQIIKGVNPVYPLLFSLGSFLQFFIRAYRWGIILKPYKKKIKLSTLYNYTMIGYFINFLVPGRVGEPAKGILLAKNLNIPRSYGLASVVLERLIDFFIVVMFFLISLFFIKNNNSIFLIQIKKIAIFIFPVIIFIFFLFYLFNTRRVFPVVEKLINKISRILPEKFRARLVEFTLKFIKGLRLNLKFLDVLKLFLASIAVWFALIPCYWILMKGFDIQLGLLEIFPYFSILVVSASIPTPGMAGTMDAGSKIALTKLYNIPVDTAVAYTILFHFLVLALWVVCGLIASVVQGLNIKSIKNFKRGENEMS
ncbi:MAG: flippase-like domain-containing protein [Candidatus Aminicenantes bacterium]|nr:flippase-like domain-containing protein [Candidatus Aminicenantes bacterium]